MLVVAHHNISKPQEFWNAAKEGTKNLPASLRVHAIYPSKDQKTATCIWEASSVKDVEQYMDKMVGKYARNVCYELNEKEALGLPQIKQTMAHAN